MPGYDCHDALFHRAWVNTSTFTYIHWGVCSFSSRQSEAVGHYLGFFFYGADVFSPFGRNSAGKNDGLVFFCYFISFLVFMCVTFVFLYQCPQTLHVPPPTPVTKPASPRPMASSVKSWEQDGNHDQNKSALFHWGWRETRPKARGAKK